MATTAAPSTVSRAALTIRNSATVTTQKRSNPKVVSIGGLNSSYQRLSSGPVCGDQGYVNVVYTSRRGRKGISGGGSGLSAKCSRVGEIFQIAAIMNALTLVGVAIGFVLLRIEASVEEAE